MPNSPETNCAGTTTLVATNFSNRTREATCPNPNDSFESLVQELSKQELIDILEDVIAKNIDLEGLKEEEKKGINTSLINVNSLFVLLFFLAVLTKYKANPTKDEFLEEKLSKEEMLKKTVVHEAAHALAIVKLVGVDSLLGITCKNSGYGHVKTSSGNFYNLNEAVIQIATYMAGRMAEQVFGYVDDVGVREDIENIEEILSEVLRSGLIPQDSKLSQFLDYSNLSTASDQTKILVEEKIKKILDEAESRLKNIITKENLEPLVAALIDTKTENGITWGRKEINDYFGEQFDSFDSNLWQKNRFH